MILPKLIFTDIDGVWTDGSMYYSESSDEFKKFHTSDGAGVKFAQLNNIPVAIITGENTKIVLKRATKLNVDYVFQGVKNKVQVATELCEKLGIAIKDCAFIGDDLNDYNLLNIVGLSGCPKNAQPLIKSIVSHSTEKKGGDGAFREFVEYILSENGLLNLTQSKLIDEMLKYNK